MTASSLRTLIFTVNELITRLHNTRHRACSSVVHVYQSETQCFAFSMALSHLLKSLWRSLSAIDDVNVVDGIEKVTSNFILSAEIGNISTPFAAPAINAAPKDVASVIEDRMTGSLIKLACSCSSRLLTVIPPSTNNSDIGNPVSTSTPVIILLKAVIIHIMKNEKKISLFIRQNLQYYNAYGRRFVSFSYMLTVILVKLQGLHL